MTSAGKPQVCTQPSADIPPHPAQLIRLSPSSVSLRSQRSALAAHLNNFISQTNSEDDNQQADGVPALPRGSAEIVARQTRTRQRASSWSSENEGGQTL